MDDKAIKYRLVGYEGDSIYRLLAPDGKIIRYTNVYFQEKRPAVIINLTSISVRPEQLTQEPVTRDSLFSDAGGRITKQRRRKYIPEIYKKPELVDLYPILIIQPPHVPATGAIGAQPPAAEVIHDTIRINTTSRNRPITRSLGRHPDIILLSEL